MSSRYRGRSVKQVLGLDTLIAGFERRYDEALAQAFAVLPAGAPPRRRGRGGWREHQRQAWNVASRMTKHKTDILRFLTDTRIPFTNTVRREISAWSTPAEDQRHVS